jgi:hypothetical protein
VEFPVSGAVNDVDQQLCDYENSTVFVGAVHGVLLRSDSPADGQEIPSSHAWDCKTHVGAPGRLQVHSSVARRPAEKR